MVEFIEFIELRILKLLTDKYFAEYERKVGGLDGAIRMLTAKTREVSFELMIEASAVYSSNIEGNPIDLDSWMNDKLLKEKLRPKAYQEIQDLIDAYGFARANTLVEGNILKAHGKLTQQFRTKSNSFREKCGCCLTTSLS